MQRPEQFRINPYSHLAQGLVFAGLGAHAGSTHCHDSSLFGNHGTLTNMTPADDWVWIPDLGRWGLDLDGSNDITISSRRTPFSNEFTVALWINNHKADYTANGYVISEYEYGSNLRQWGVVINTSEQLSVATGTGGAGGVTNGTYNLAENTWTHLAVQFNSSAQQARIYINGAFDELLLPSSQFTDLGSRLTLGGLISANYIDAQIADPLKINRALSLPEIQQLADPSNSLLSGLILPPRRKWWPVVSAPAAFKPAWALKSNNLIGSGVG